MVLHGARDRVDLGDAPTRLHRLVRVAVLHETFAHDPVGAGERGVDVAVVAVVALQHVAVRSGPDRRPGGIERVLDGRDRRQLLVVDLHELRGVLGDVARLGDDERHRIADDPHAVDGERVEQRVVQARERQQAHERVGERLHVGARVHRDDAGMAASRVDVDAADERVRERAAHEVACSMPGTVTSST